MTADLEALARLVVEPAEPARRGDAERLMALRVDVQQRLDLGAALPWWPLGHLVVGDDRAAEVAARAQACFEANRRALLDALELLSDPVALVALVPEVGCAEDVAHALTWLRSTPGFRVSSLLVQRLVRWWIDTRAPVEDVAEPLAAAVASGREPLAAIRVLWELAAAWARTADTAQMGLRATGPALEAIARRLGMLAGDGTPVWSEDVRMALAARKLDALVGLLAFLPWSEEDAARCGVRPLVEDVERRSAELAPVPTLGSSVGDLYLRATARVMAWQGGPFHDPPWLGERFGELRRTPRWREDAEVRLNRLDWGAWLVVAAVEALAIEREAGGGSGSGAIRRLLSQTLAIRRDWLADAGRRSPCSGVAHALALGASWLGAPDAGAHLLDLARDVVSRSQADRVRDVARGVLEGAQLAAIEATLAPWDDWRRLVG